MTMPEIRNIAKDMNIQGAARMNKQNLIHAIQEREGNYQCFSVDPAGCGQDGCLWRTDCIKAAKAK